jgi:hypothetical protein
VSQCDGSQVEGDYCPMYCEDIADPFARCDVMCGANGELLARNSTNVYESFTCIDRTYVGPLDGCPTMDGLYCNTYTCAQGVPSFRPFLLSPLWSLFRTDKKTPLLAGNNNGASQACLNNVCTAEACCSSSPNTPGGSSQTTAGPNGGSTPTGANGGIQVLRQADVR